MTNKPLTIEEITVGQTIVVKNLPTGKEWTCVVRRVSDTTVYTNHGNFDYGDRPSLSNEIYAA